MSRALHRSLVFGDRSGRVKSLGLCVGRLALVLLILAVGVRAAEPRTIRGRVVDESGKPVADAAVDEFWRANGTGTDKAGKTLDFSKPEDVNVFWGNLGRMEPHTAARGREKVVTTGPDGRFSMAYAGVHRAVMAMDRARRRGGLVVIPKDPEAPVEIRLGPLVRVFGSFEGPASGQRPAWTHVYINLPEDPSRPIDSPRLVSCGSFEAKFDVRLPPGSYRLQAYSQFADKDLFEGDLVPERPIALKGDVPEVDLGTLTFAPYGDQLSEKIEEAKSDGSWSDYTKHFGEPPPRWHVTEAKGVPKETQPSDFKGKWLLVDFWGFGCRPCLKTGLPKLMAFDEAHASQRDRYQILTVCIEDDGSVASMADVDRKLAPILEHVWGRMTFPFPILLDTTFQTWERYGLPGLGTVILIDPQGKLVPGDEKVLAERLEGAGGRPGVSQPSPP